MEVQIGMELVQLNQFGWCERPRSGDHRWAHCGMWRTLRVVATSATGCGWPKSVIATALARFSRATIVDEK